MNESMNEWFSDGQCLHTLILGKCYSAVPQTYPSTLTLKLLTSPHLEYCTPVWSPHYRKDKDLLERVQHRFTRMFSHLRHLEYEERLNTLGPWSLEERRNRADLLEVYKMASGKSGNTLHDLFTVDKKVKTRTHSLKLIKKYSKGNTRHHFFTERVVSRWNSLPHQAVCAPSINTFKGHLTRIRNMKMGFFKIAEPQSQSRLNRIGQPGK